MRIAQATGLSRSTVSRILTRLRLNKAKMLDPQPPVVRYEHAAPGDLLHIDIRKLARIVKPGHGITGNPRDETRGAGWEFLYVAIDDRSRIAFTTMMPDEKAASSAAFLRDAVAWFARIGIRVRRVMTDNGPCFYSDLFRDTCRALDLRHLRPASTPRKPTVKPNPSSRPPSASGLTCASIRTPPIASATWPRGPTSTTGTALTAPSTNPCPSPAPASMSTTS